MLAFISWIINKLLDLFNSDGRLSSLVRADVAGSGVGGQAFMVSRMMIIMKIMVTTMMLEKQGSVCTYNTETIEIAR